MAPARAAASAEAQSVVERDLDEFVNLAKELAQAAGSITRQYFRCDQFAASLAFLVDHDNSTLAGSPWLLTTKQTRVQWQRQTGKLKGQCGI